MVAVGLCLQSSCLLEEGDWRLVVVDRSVEAVVFASLGHSVVPNVESPDWSVVPVVQLLEVGVRIRRVEVVFDHPYTVDGAVAAVDAEGRSSDSRAGEAYAEEGVVAVAAAAVGVVLAGQTGYRWEASAYT